jgi:WD40-like Beta Propeller Repeat
LQRCVIWVVAIVSVALLGLAPTAEATFPGGNGRIAFSRNAGGPVYNNEVFTMQPDGSDVQRITNSPGDDIYPAWSRDGTRIAFASDRAGTLDIYVMDADGSDVLRLTTRSNDDSQPSWSPDGQWIAFQGDDCDNCPNNIYKVRSDGTDLTQLTHGPTSVDHSRPDWSPDGTRIAFDSYLGVSVMNADGTSPHEVDSTGSDPSWAPEGYEIVFIGGPGFKAVSPDGGSARGIPAYKAYQPEYSPNGGQIVYQEATCDPWDDSCYVFDGAITIINRDGSGKTAIGLGNGPSWQRTDQPPYARPKGATPLNATLVVAYRQCTSPDRQHGPPLAFSSCAGLLSPTSDSVTVGTADSNGAQARFVGSVRLDALLGNPSTTTDEADVKVTARLPDIRCTSSATACAGGTLSDYTGEMRVVVPLRITDAYVQGLPATSQGGVSVPIACVTTADPAVGSTCDVTTTVDSVLPGAVRERNRTIWELGVIEVWDGGQDGALSTSDDDQLFARQGIFVP